MQFMNRTDAGRQLARLLKTHVLASPVVIGVTRGGVPVAAEIAAALSAPLDMCAVRALLTPTGAMIGAVAEGGAVYLDPERVERSHLSASELQSMMQHETEHAQRLAVLLRDEPPLRLTGRDVILVDDGLQTPCMVGAALYALHRQRPRLIELALPVADAAALSALRPEVDRVTCLSIEDVVSAVGARYADYDAVSEAEIVDLLAASRRAAPTVPSVTVFSRR